MPDDQTLGLWKVTLAYASIFDTTKLQEETIYFATEHVTEYPPDALKTFASDCQKQLTGAGLMAQGYKWEYLGRVANSTNSTNSTDHDAMLAIQELLDGVEWSPDTLDSIAQILEGAGYRVRDSR